ncbi:MAG: YfhO family protein [Dysgonamonadaceae bacterium]|nr:YfhO family protein [Dysgonamonadaceae bacterium]
MLTLVYFYPAFEGKILQQGDITNYQGMAHELEEYGKLSGWTGSMFGGMPSYHITGYNTGIDFMGYVRNNVLGSVQSDTSGPILILLISAYLLFLVLGAPWWLSVVGAIAMAFSSYNIIIIEAGHITKAWTLAFVPLLLSGIFLIFKRKYWIGFVVFTSGLAFAIGANHLQITYYTALFCVLLFIGFWVDCIRKKACKHAGLATGILIAGTALALLSSARNLYLNYESGQESMRGKAELTPPDADEIEKTVSTGLDKDYVFVWSYGKAETLSLLIPNVMGGSSGGTVGKDSHLYKESKAHNVQVGKDGVQTYTYWGEKPFTSGPVYFGAVICFLFLFALFIVPKNFKWWLLGATVFFIFLAWGRNFAAFNDWMYYHFPLYGKFRAVEMALVIPAFTFPILAVLAIKELIKNNIPDKKLVRSLQWSAGITAGICLLLWLAPGAFFHFESTYDAQFQSQAPEWYYFSLLEDRKDLLSADALRSFIFIALSAGLIFLYIQSKNRRKVLPFVAAGLLILVLTDLWSVDKRYLNEKNFLNKKNYKEQQFPKSVSDNHILPDPALSYRVLNLNNPFNESRTSYYHKSIGGYHAAKLGRYQDLIDRRLTKEIQSIIAVFQTATTLEDLAHVCENCPTLNMLNAKYIVYHPEQPPLVNPYINGNAWFVQSYRFTDTPDDEMAALETLDPKTEAVLDKQFENPLAGLQIIPDSTASIEMTAYYPDKVEYQSSAAQTGLAVFSEIYYKNGWKAFIDGKQVPISRADWLLRALVIPAGEHHIEFVFDPDDVQMAGTVTTVFSGLLLLLIIGSIVYVVMAGLTRHPKRIVKK